MCFAYGQTGSGKTFVRFFSCCLNRLEVLSIKLIQEVYPNNLFLTWKFTIIF